eukprot:2169453-Pleurochrysis_carterae.AAC.1
MEVRTPAAAASASVAWDPRSTRPTRSAAMVRARTGVGDEDGLRACLAMCVGRLAQLRKASTFRIVWVNKIIYQRTSQVTHDPAHVHQGCVRLHILQ